MTKEIAIEGSAGMFRKLTAVFLSLLMVAAFLPVPALAQGDATAPSITNITVNKTALNVGDVLTITAKITDGSGINYCEAEIYEISYFWRIQVELKPVTGKPGYYSCSFTIPEEMYDGFYYAEIHAWANNEKLAIVNCGVHIRIHNPENVFVYAEPKLTSFSIDSSAKAGDSTTVEASVDYNGLKCNPEDLDTAWLQFYPQGHKDAAYFFDVPLQKKSSGKYSGSFTLPVEWGGWTFIVSRIYFTIGHSYCLSVNWPKQYCDSKGNLTKAFFHFTSVFSGVDNCTLPVGASFDPLAGVSSGNKTEGDMTDKIEVTGSVDVNTVGIYLLKYQVLSSQTDITGKQTSYYTDFRWVGVTEVAPDPSAGSGTLVVTDGAVKIGAAAGDITLTRDGKPQAYAASITAAGTYVAFMKEQSGSSEKAVFIIDSKGPTVTASYSIVSPTKINVSAACKDPSGVVETRWKAGTATLADIRTTGAVFSKTFTVGTFGMYTVYARDRLGHESLKAFRIRSVAVTSIKLNKKSTRLAVGKKLQLTAVVTPANATFKTLTWSSSNIKVVTVDSNGKVTAVGRGTAYVFAKAANGTFARCKITVS